MSRHPLQAVVTGKASLTSALRLLPPESRPSWTEPVDVRSRVAQMRRVQRELNHKDLTGAGPVSWQLAMRAHFQKGCDLSDLEAALLCAELPERAWPQALTGLLDTMHQLDRLDNEEVAACTGLSVQEVNAVRAALGVPAAAPDLLALGLGEVSDWLVARRANVPVMAVVTARQAQGFTPRPLEPALYTIDVEAVRAASKMRDYTEADAWSLAQRCDRPDIGEREAMLAMATDDGWDTHVESMAGFEHLLLDGVDCVSALEAQGYHLTAAVALQHQMREVLNLTPPAEAQPKALPAVVEPSAIITPEPPPTALDWATDGRVVDLDTFQREILHHANEMVVHAWEAGRRLCAVKETLPHGSFGRWCKERLPFNERHAQKLMALATWLRGHEGLVTRLSAAPLRKVLKLTALPVEAVEQAMGGSLPVDTVAPELGEKPYSQALEELDRLLGQKLALENTLTGEKRAHEATKQALDAANAEVERRGAALAEKAGVTPKTDAEVIAETARLWNGFDAALLKLVGGLDTLAARWPELSAEARARIEGLNHYMLRRVELEHLRLRDATTGVTGLEWREHDDADAARPGGNVYPLPASRRTRAAEG